MGRAEAETATGFCFVTQDSKAEFILNTDASAFLQLELCCIKCKKGKREIAYGNKGTLKEERHYNVRQRELLVVVHFMKYYRHYLYVQKFTVCADQRVLRWLTYFWEPQIQVAQWLEVFETYIFEIEHPLGLKHNNADYL